MKRLLFALVIACGPSPRPAAPVSNTTGPAAPSSTAESDTDADTDGDGVLDRVDVCPADPEDFDGFEDTDGCPDVDNDKDTIPDAADKCPFEPETFNGKTDDDGCPP